MEANTSELRRLAGDLGRASTEIVKVAEAETEKAAHNIKTTMADEARSDSSTRHFADSISYDRATALGFIGYEIGPDKNRRQGALGNLLYFGSANNGPKLDVESGMRKEAPEYERRMADRAAGLLDG